MSIQALPSVFVLPSTRRLIELALEEDLSQGDPASTAIFSSKAKSSARLVARESLVVCGLPIIEEILQLARSTLKVSILVAEGKHVTENQVLAKLSGPTGEILSLERTLLNFVQRLSGVATAARSWVAQANGITILDTRKTIPGYRHLDKYATSIGGAKNHRMNLGAMAMVKNNHIDASGFSIGEISKLIREKGPLGLPLEIEVRNLKELNEAIKSRPAVIMLDNMNDREIERAFVSLKNARCESLVEVSGGVTIDRLPKLKELGVQYVSVGALTHSVRAADISLRIN